VRTGKEHAVLIAVLKDRRDRRLLLREGWYRIPVRRAPRRAFDYIAFYQPEKFGRDSKRIRYYARIRRVGVVLRRELLPSEPRHPRAAEPYFRFRLGPVRELAKPILNTAPRRVSFGFTTRKRLLASRELLRLYAVPHIERILLRALKRAGIEAKRELTVRAGKRRRYRLDLAVECRGGRVAIECDGADHETKSQRRRDRVKDAFLGRSGWKVLRFKDREILGSSADCVARVVDAVRVCGGI
jgi:very-short-patch-repair endonuclease